VTDMSKDKSRIIERITNLIALAGSPEPDEARTAAVMACAMLREEKVSIPAAFGRGAPTATEVRLKSQVAMYSAMVESLERGATKAKADAKVAAAEVIRANAEAAAATVTLGFANKARAELETQLRGARIRIEALDRELATRASASVPPAVAEAISKSQVAIEEAAKALAIASSVVSAAQRPITAVSQPVVSVARQPIGARVAAVAAVAPAPPVDREFAFVAADNKPSISGIQRNKVRVISSRYDGVCMACSKDYKRGDSVLWARDIGSTHRDCDAYWERLDAVST